MSSDASRREGISSDLFRRIMDQGSNAIYVVDPGTGDILDVNKKSSDMLGWSRSELLEMNVAEIEDNLSKRFSWSDYMDEVRDYPSFTIDSTHVRKDGTKIPVAVDHDVLSVDGREFVLVTVRDREERNDERDAILEEYSHYRKLFENSPVGLLELDLSETFSYLGDLYDEHSEDFMRFLDGNPEVIDRGIDKIDFLDVNKRALEIFGADDRQDLLDNLETLTTSDVRNQLQTDILRILEGSTQRQSEYRTRTLDGEDLHLLTDYLISPDLVDDLSEVFVAVMDISEQKGARRALRQSEERYRTLFEKAKVGMAEVSLDEEWLRVNSRIREILGYTEEEFLAMENCAVITHPDDLHRDRQKAEALIDGEIDHFSVEKRYQKKDGDYLWTRLTAGLVEPGGDRQPYMISTIEDISQEKEYKDRLEESEKKFRQLAENIREVFWLTDGEKNETLYVSPASEEIWGLSPEDDYDHPDNWMEQIHPEDREEVTRNVVQRQRSGEYDEEYRIVRPDGEIRWVHDRAFPITDDEGNVVRIAGIAEDITERKQLRQQREAFYDVIPDLFVIADHDGRFRDVNSTCEEKLGYSEEELTSRSYLDFVHPDDREETREKINQLGAGDSVQDYDNRYCTKGGDYVWLNWQAISVNDLVYAVARDVTEHRKRERQLQAALDEKEILMGEIHHRVKNNLQIVNSILSMKQRDVENDRLTDAISSCINRIKSMALIHEKLYESNRLGHLDLAQYLRDLSEHLRGLHGPDTDGVHLEYDLFSKSIKLDQAIPCGLILNELLTNSLKYAYGEEESGTIRVSTDFRESRGYLVVEDQGSGLPERVMDDDVSTFGLDMVETLAEYELKGCYSINSENGTRIEIEFPLDEEHNA